MVVVQDRSLRKPSGGRNTSTRPKRQHMAGSKPSMTHIGEQRIRKKRARSGSQKTGLLSSNIANVYDSKTKKHSKAKILSVKESSANRNYVRRNIITKGTVIETEKGMATVTNRPGQEKIINAILK